MYPTRFLIQSLAIYLRSHKYEPFLWLSIAVAALTLAGTCIFAPRWGTLGAAGTYFACTGITGALAATVIFYSHHRRKLRLHPV